jgi:hypothetical protein
LILLVESDLFSGQREVSNAHLLRQPALTSAGAWLVAERPDALNHIAS